MLRCGKGPQDYRIITGRSRDSTMVLVTNMARAALIVAVATSMGMFGRDKQRTLSAQPQAGGAAGGDASPAPSTADLFFG